MAELYHVLTKNLNLSVRRNVKRFPKDFMFQLQEAEVESLRLQFATSNESRGGRRYLPYAFTEHGVAMLSSILKSDRAVQMNILVIRAFVRMRELLLTHKDLAERLEHLEKKQKDHSSVIRIIADEIEKLERLPPLPSKPKIGFVVNEASKDVLI